MWSDVCVCKIRKMKGHANNMFVYCHNIGAWGIHFVIIVVLKIFYDSLPGVSQETSWTLTNISYTVVSRILISILLVFSTKGHVKWLY